MERCISDNVETIERVSTLELKVDEISKGNSSSHESFDICLSEVEDRLRRKNNLVVFGLRESPDSNNSNMHEADVTILKSLFSNLCTTKSIGTIQTWRLGVFSSSRSKPRPIKVRLPFDICSSQIRQSFMEMKKLSQLPPEFTHLSLAPDRTKYQQLEYQRVKKELQSRIQQGETDIRIVYRMEAPIIVKQAKA